MMRAYAFLEDSTMALEMRLSPSSQWRLIEVEADADQRSSLQRKKEFDDCIYNIQLYALTDSQDMRSNMEK